MQTTEELIHLHNDMHHWAHWHLGVILCSPTLVAWVSWHHKHNKHVSCLQRAVTLSSNKQMCQNVQKRLCRAVICWYSYVGADLSTCIDSVLTMSIYHSLGIIFTVAWSRFVKVTQTWKKSLNSRKKKTMSLIYLLYLKKSIYWKPFPVF